MVLSHIALGVGLVLVIEGLVFALAPSRMEDLIKALSDIPPQTRRTLGLVAIAVGTGLVWVGKSALVG